MSYVYYAAGNIQTVSKSGTVYDQYAYDELGQLIREDNKDANKSYTYTYDSRGNILEKKTYAFTLGTLGTVQSTHTYGYATDSWRDRLTSYNGQTITYDAIGNPLTYNNGSAYTFTWEGRQMQSASKGNQTYSYTYNSDGLRASKTVGNTTYHYYWNSGKLIAMTYDDHYMIFTYTESGTPFSVTCYDAYLDKEYECLYITNLQGDVVGIYDAAKSSMVISYTYDAWGRLVGKDGTSSDYAQLEMNNPLLYRGYQYDYETGFYYLQSRYYDPSVGRFLNADDTGFLGISGALLGWNLFAYCESAPINKVDIEGTFGTPIQWACATIGGIAGWLFGDFVARSIGLFDGKWYQWQTYAYWAVRGLVVVGGAIFGYVAGTVLLKILTRFVLTNPSITAKLPKILLWFLGIGGNSGKIADELFARYASHIFSQAHIADGIMKLGTTQRNIFNKIFDIVSSKIMYAQDGPNQIHTMINGFRVTIRFYFHDGQVKSIDAFIGWANRIIGNLIK